MIRKVKSGYRVISHISKKNMGTFNTTKQAKNRLRQIKYFGSLKIIVLFILLFGFISLTSALEFDNVKSYDTIKKEITITNAFGMGETLEKITLRENTYSCGYECFAIKDIELYKEGKIIDSIKFERIKGNSGLKSYKFEMEVGKEVVNEYERHCIEEKVLQNGSTNYQCENKIVGNKEESIWEEIDINKEFAVGSYKIRLSGIKNNPYDTLDWIITTQGKEIMEWALWGASAGDAKIESSETGETNEVPFSYDNGHRAYQTFTVGRQTTVPSNANLTKIQLRITQKQGSPNNAFLEIYNKNTSTWLANSTSYSLSAGYHNFTFPTGVILENGYQYEIRASKNSGNGGNLYWLARATSNAYDGGAYGEEGSYGSYDLQFAVFVSVGQYNLTIIEPINISYNSAQTSLKYKMESGGVDCWASTNGGITNTSHVACGINFTGLTSNEGSNTWTVWANTTTNEIGKESTTFTVDTIKPAVNILYPNGTITYGFVGQNISFNYTATDAGGLDSCWYEYEGANKTMSCIKNSTFIMNNSLNIKVWANDTVNNYNYSSKSINFLVFDYNLSQTAQVQSGELVTFANNLTLIGTPTVASVLLTYNNTNYTATMTNPSGNSYIITRNVYSPSVTSQTNINYNWIYILSNGSIIFTPTMTQVVTPVLLAECDGTTYNVTAINFSILDEINGTALEAAMQSNVNYYTSSGLINQNFYYTHLPENRTSFSFCVYPAAASFNGTGIFSYSKSGYSPRDYHINNFLINNQTQNISLYLISTAASDIVEITVVDSDLNAISGALVEVQKWNIGNNSYTHVTSFLSDSNGQGGINLQLYDTYYRYIVKINGETKLTTSPAKETTTTRQLIVDTGEVLDYHTYLGVTGLVSYNNNTKTVLFSYDDSSSSLSQACLRLLLPNATEFITINTTCITSQSGSITYVFPISAENGSYLAQGIIVLDAEHGGIFGVLDSLWLQLNAENRNEIIGEFGQVITTIMVISAGAVGAAAGSIVLGLALIICSIVFALFMGFINFNLYLVLGAIITIAIIIALISYRRIF